MRKVVKVDVSEERLTVYDGFNERYSCKVQTGRAGTGKKLGSGRTPIGEYKIFKEPGHRYGKVFRLSGYQGNNRGILIHRDLTRYHGTGGCICPDTHNEMSRVYDLVPSGSTLIIQQ